VTTRHLQQRTIIDRFEAWQTAFDGAESARLMSQAALENAQDGIIGISSEWTPQYDSNNRLILPPFDSEFVSAVPLVIRDSDPPLTVDIISWAVDWSSDNWDNNGDGVADDALETGIFSIHSAARFGGQIRRVEAVYRSYDINV